MKHLISIILFTGLVLSQSEPVILNSIKGKNINKELENKNFAIFRIEEPFFWANAGIGERIQSELLQQNFTVVDRDLLNTTIQERNLSMAGITIGSSDVFSVLNIDYVITGSARSGIFKLLNVENGALVSTSIMTNYGPRDDNINLYTRLLVQELIYSMETQQQLLFQRKKSLLITDKQFNDSKSRQEDKVFLSTMCYSFAIGFIILAIIDTIGPDDGYE